MDGAREGSTARSEGGPAEAGAAGGLSRHALRTPLLAIRSASELLLAGAGGPLAAAARELVGAIAAAAAALGPLLELLLRAALAGGRRRSALVLRTALGAAGIEHEGGGADVRVRVEAEAFAALLAIAAAALGGPVVARTRAGRRTGAVLLELAGRGPPPLDEDGRLLLAGLLVPLARRAGVRRVAAAPGRIALVAAVAGELADGTREAERRSGGSARSRGGTGAAGG